jgi:hypothetical protein
MIGMMQEQAEWWSTCAWQETTGWRAAFDRSGAAFTGCISYSALVQGCLYPRTSVILAAVFVLGPQTSILLVTTDSYIPQKPKGHGSSARCRAPPVYFRHLAKRALASPYCVQR